jgi:hypothetical protein
MGIPTRILCRRDAAAQIAMQVIGAVNGFTDRWYSGRHVPIGRPRIVRVPATVNSHLLIRITKIIDEIAQTPEEPSKKEED